MRKFLCLRALVAIVIATLGVSDSFAQTGVEEQLVFLGTTMTKENGNNLDPEHKIVLSINQKVELGILLLVHSVFIVRSTRLR